MIVGIGTDIIEIKRIEKALRESPRFREKLLTDKEKEYFNQKGNKVESIAGSFAAKEAVSKALGTGFRNFGMEDIEIIRDELGKPNVYLLGKAKILGESLKIAAINLTISHCKEYAVAFVMIEGRDLGEISN